MFRDSAHAVRANCILLSEKQQLPTKSDKNVADMRTCNVAATHNRLQVNNSKSGLCKILMLNTTHLPSAEVVIP